MSGLDIVIAAVFVVSILIGIMRGFVKEFLSIVSWIMAIWLAITFCVQGGEFIAQYIDIPNQKFRTWAGFSAIFIITLFVFAVISFVLAKLFANGAVKGTDRMLGIGFGALRAAAIIVAVVLVGRGLALENNEWWTGSKFLPYFEPTAAYVETILPEGWRTDSETQDETIKDQVIKGIINNSVQSSES